MSKKVPKMYWGRPNPNWRPEGESASHIKVDGHVQSARDDFNFKRTGMVLHDPSGDFYHYTGEDDEDTSIIDIDGDGIDDRDEITSEEVVSGKFPTVEMTRKFCYESSAWMVKNSGIPNVAMTTIHGDFLYGTATLKTTPAFYIVSEDNISMDISIGENKLTVIGINQFAEELYNFNIKAIEARYSPYCVFSSDETRSRIYASVISEKEIKSAMEKEIKRLSQSSEGLRNVDRERLEHSQEMAMAGKYTPVYRQNQ